MDRYLKLREKTIYNYSKKQSQLQSNKKNKKLSKPQKIVYRNLRKTPATVDEISRIIHEKSIQNIKKILSQTPSSGDSNKNEDYLPTLEETTKRVKTTLKSLEKIDKIVNKNGKYSIVTQFTTRKKNFKPRKSPLRKMKRKSNSNSNKNTKNNYNIK